MRVVAVLPALVLLASLGCRGGGLGKAYEYEEEIHLSVDGSATVVVNASLPALVALRGLELPVDPGARVDRAAVRLAYESPVTRVTRVSRPWRRAGRRFVQVRLEAADIRELSLVRPFARSTYHLGSAGDLLVYRQILGEAAGAVPAGVNWTGGELVAVRLHLPSRIHYHTAGAGNLRRGNILVWEQPLRERLAGAPLEMEARMERRSILYRTLWLFASAFAAAAGVLVAAIWYAGRRGRPPAAAGQGDRSWD
jgi:hypothetical protein